MELVAVVAVVEAVPVEFFLEVGEVVIGAGVVAQGGHSLEVGVVWAFEVVVPEGILGAEEPEVVEVVFVDHSTLTFVNLQYYCSLRSLAGRPCELQRCCLVSCSG